MRCHLGLVAAVLGGLAVGCVEYGSMDGIQIHEVAGKPGGIYQGPNPPPNTVRDMCNISTHKGSWTLRPGFTKIKDFPSGKGIGTVLAEYLVDNRYDTSHYPAIISLHHNTTTYAAYEHINTESENEITYPEGHIAYNNRPSWVRTLKRYSAGGSVRYTPAIMFCDGMNPPVIYSQESGAGVISELESMDGGLEDMTYLELPPIGKFLAVWNDRVFIANTQDGANRIYYTSVDEAGAWTANIWPAAYNMDVGHDEEITGLVPSRDALFVFTRKRIYALTGDGVGGAYSVQVLDPEHGASPNCIVDTGGRGIFFAGEDAAYLFNGSSSKNISSPAIEKLWKVYPHRQTSTTGFFMTRADHDPERQLVLYGTGDTFLVYDLVNGAWSRWGKWDEGANGSLYPGNYTNTWSSGQGYSIFGRRILFIDSNNNCIFRLSDQTFDYSTSAVSVNAGPIHAFIHTNPMATGPTTKHLLGLGVKAKRNGSWYLSVIAMEDSEDPFEAFTKSATKLCMIVSETTNDTFGVDRTPAFTQATAGEEADYYSLRTLQKEYSGTVKSAVAGEIVYAVGPDTFNVDSSRYGEMFLVEAGAKNRVEFDMNGPIPTEQWDGDNNFPLADVEHESLSSPANGVGRSFSLYITNVGTYWSGIGTYEYAKTCAAIDIEGWWVETLDRGVTRRGWTR